MPHIWMTTYPTTPGWYAIKFPTRTATGRSVGYDVLRLVDTRGYIEVVDNDGEAGIEVDMFAPNIQWKGPLDLETL